MKKITTFGEIMLRISPQEKGERLNQSVNFRIEPGGSEANVAVALSNLGLSTEFVTKLPDNPLSEKTIQFLQQFNVDTSNIIKLGTRLGIYWTENGIGPRNSFVIYDRNNSSFSEINSQDFNWREIFRSSSWFHFSGISPSISKNVYDELINALSEITVPYSVDLNFRSKLWEWADKEPSRINNIMTKLCKNAILIGGNESDFQNIFQINLNKKLNTSLFEEIAEECFVMFPKLKYLSISNRKAISASSNIWSGHLFVKESKISNYIGIRYNLESIEDRVGTGDSFIAGIIFGLINKEQYTYQETVDFACTLAALNHSTIGDVSRFSEKEVLSVLKNKGTGRIIR